MHPSLMMVWGNLTGDKGGQVGKNETMTYRNVYWKYGQA
jgi:hypothetical protein